MNIGDAVKTVFRKRSRVLAQHWKQDVKFILREIKDDFQRFAKSTHNSIKHVRQNGFRYGLKEYKDSAADTLIIMRLLPSRIKEGVSHFKNDFVSEIESEEDPKHKTVFTLKVLGALTSFTLGPLYQVKKGRTDISLPGLKNKNVFTNFIVAELLFKLTHLFVQHLLSELEAIVTDEEELQHIRYFKQLLSDRQELQMSEDEPLEGDKAIEIVEALRIYIMTGKRFD